LTALQHCRENGEGYQGLNRYKQAQIWQDKVFQALSCRIAKIARKMDPIVPLLLLDSSPCSKLLFTLCGSSE
jgi:hypothetical protein